MREEPKKDRESMEQEGFSQHPTRELPYPVVRTRAMKLRGLDGINYNNIMISSPFASLPPLGTRF